VSVPFLSACSLMSNAEGGPKGLYTEPAAELGFRNFVASLMAKAIAVAKLRARSSGLFARNKAPDTPALSVLHLKASAWQRFPRCPSGVVLPSCTRRNRQQERPPRKPAKKLSSRSLRKLHASTPAARATYPSQTFSISSGHALVSRKALSSRASTS
jgi:hypothetical protein